MSSSGARSGDPPDDIPLAVLPIELITEILSFSDVKSLSQMKCVSKSWKSLISDPRFVKLHLKRSGRNPYLSLLLSKSRVEGENNVVPYPVRGLIENPVINLPDDECSRLMNKDCRYVVGSCNGLLCLLGYSSNCEYRGVWFCVWNPALGKMSQKFGYFYDLKMGLFTHFRFAFGYDNYSGTYKIVVLILDEIRNTTDVQVCSIGNYFWRTIQNFPAVPLPFRHTNPGMNDGVYLNGSLNWLALASTFRSMGAYGWKNVNVKEFVIVSLDLGTERFRLFRPPIGFDAMSPVEPSVCILKDSLCFCHDYQRAELVIWKMEIFGVVESWTPLLNISYHSLRSIHYDFADLQFFQWLPLHLSDNGDTLILANNQERQAILYNLRDNRAVRTRVTDQIQWFSTKVYVESLVSDFLIINHPNLRNIHP